MKRMSFAYLKLPVVVVTLAAALGCSSGSSGSAANAGAASSAGGAAGSVGVGGGSSSDAGATSTDFSNVPATGFGAGISGTSDGKPFTFYPALENGAMGDYRGYGSYVAQITPLVGGGYQADLLHAFAVPSDQPVAVLSGVVSGVSGDSVMFSGAGWTGVLSQGHFTGQNGTDSFDLQYFEHAAPTLGAAPPPGAVVLFDGTNLDAWAKKDATNWLQQAGPAPWSLVAGNAVEVVPGTDGIISKQTFGDFTLHLEYRTLGSPTNSGVLLEARYESNINEVYGLYNKATGGGFDNCTPAASKLQTRATRPPLAWQTLDITFVAPRFDASNKKTASANATVDLNGIRIYDKAQLDPPTGAAQRFGESATGPVMLQEHGMKLQFRNIWLVEASQ